MRRCLWLVEVVVLAVFALGLAACSSCSKPDSEPDLTPATNADKDRAKTAAEEAMAGLRAADAKRTSAIVKALASSGPRGDLGPCPISVVGPQSHELRDASALDDVLLPVVSARMTRVAFAEVGSTPGLRMQMVGERVVGESRRPARGLLAGKPEETIKNLAEPQAFPWEVVVVIDERSEPRLLDDKHFEGGLVVGRAFLYSYVEETVLCASLFIAGSSKRLGTYDKDPKTVRDTLLGDLENEAMRSAAFSMVRVGPRLGDAGAARGR